MQPAVFDFSTVPLWLLALMIFIAMIVACEFGYLLRRRRSRRGRDEDANKDDGFSLTAVMGLLALLIAFTFSLTLQHYESRRELVVNEANALGTTWLRTQLLDEPARSQLQDLLRRYVAVRLEYGRARTQVEEEAAYRKTEAMQQQLWEATTAAVAPFRTTALTPLLITTTNESIDLAAARMAMRAARVPTRILVVLAIYALITAGMVGYGNGRHRTATTVLFVLLTLAAVLIIDLDRPSTGAITVSQQPMLDLQRSIGLPD